MYPCSLDSMVVVALNIHFFFLYATRRTFLLN